MSTTEQPGAWDEPPRAETSSIISLGHGSHVWADDAGGCNAIARLGEVSIRFHHPQQIRDVIAYLAGLAGQMDAEVARQQPAEKETVPEQAPCPRCGATDVPKAQDSDRCHNALQCADRALARETAKAGTR